MQSKIEKQVMASVAVIYAARKLLSRTALELYVLAASAVMLWQLVWVHKVFANFFTVEKHGFGAMSNYLLYAVEHTHLAVQLTLLVAALALASLLVDFVKSVSAERLLAL
jgi:hypothetical protein